MHVGFSLYTFNPLVAVKCYHAKKIQRNMILSPQKTSNKMHSMASIHPLDMVSRVIKANNSLEFPRGAVFMQNWRNATKTTVDSSIVSCLRHAVSPVHRWCILLTLSRLRNMLPLMLQTTRTALTDIDSSRIFTFPLSQCTVNAAYDQPSASSV